MFNKNQKGQYEYLIRVYIYAMEPTTHNVPTEEHNM